MARAAAKLIEVDPRQASAPTDALRVELSPARTAPKRLAREWDELARTPAEPNIFSERGFLEASLDNLERGRDLKMLEVWDGAELIGLMPLCISSHYGRLPVRHAENWLHPHSFLGTPLVHAGREKEFWTAALRALDGDRWALSFLHLCKMTEDGPVLKGLKAAAAAIGRRVDTVFRFERALLESDLSPEAYYEATVRKKKRKELKRLSHRLSELGKVETRWLGPEDDLTAWCDEYLALEAAGWKGRAGSAAACDPATEAFFRQTLASAHRAGELDIVRMDLDGRAIAMLVNFVAPPASFSFKIAFDEDYARFSPGVLIQIENLRILSRPDVAWMDSCAVADHSMINSLWGERRRLVRVSVPLRGPVRRLTFTMCRFAERASERVRRLKRAQPLPPHRSDDD